MSATAASPSLRLTDTDLLSMLRPRWLIAIALATAVFAGACLFANAGKWLLLLLVAGGSVVAILSPELGFALCVFLFAFRNDAFAIGPLKIADPLFGVTVASWAIHTFIRGKLRLHLALLVVGLYAVTDIVSGLAARAVGAYANELIRQLYLVVIFVIATQVLRDKQTFLLCVKAFLAAGLIMVLCSYAGLIAKFGLHMTGAPFFDMGPNENGVGRFGFCSIAVETERVPSYLIFPMVLVAGLQGLAKTPYQRRLCSVLFWLGCGACALSFSRAAVLYIFAALLVMWLLTRRQLPKMLAIGGAIAAVLLAVLLIPPDSPLVEEYDLQRLAVAGQLAEGHQEPRSVVWDTAWRAFKSSPLIGIGLDNVMARSMEFRDPWLAYGYLQYSGKPPHNAYLSALSETGLLGTISLLVMLGYLLQLGRRGVRAARAEGDQARYILAAAVLAGFVAQCAGGLTFQVFTSNHVWVLMSFLIPLGHFPQNKTAPAPEVAEAG